MASGIAPLESHRIPMGLAAWVTVMALFLLACCAPEALAGTGDANRSACENRETTGFREYLPDCRAYEQASPPYKAGFQIEGETYSEAESSGEAPLLLERSIGSFANGPNTTSDFTDYESRLTGSGWATSSIDPPPSQFVSDDAVNANHAAIAVAGSGNALDR